MNIYLQDNLNKSNKNSDLKNNLGGALNKMKYFSVDRKEGIYTILQNTQTHKLYEVKSSKLPPFLKDGDIVKKVGFNSYEFDLTKTNEFKDEFKKSFNQLYTNEESI